MKYSIPVLTILFTKVAAATDLEGSVFLPLRIREVDNSLKLHARQLNDAIASLRRRGIYRAQTAREEGRGIRPGRKPPVQDQPPSPHTSVKSSPSASSQNSTPSRFIPPSIKAHQPSPQQSLKGFDVPKSPTISDRSNSPALSGKAEKGYSRESSTVSTPQDGPPSPAQSRTAREGKSERSSLRTTPERSVPETPPNFRSPRSDIVKWTLPGETESPPPSRRGSPRSSGGGGGGSQYSSPEKHRSPPLQDSTPAHYGSETMADASTSFGLSGASTVQPRPPDGPPVRRKLELEEWGSRY